MLVFLTFSIISRVLVHSRWILVYICIFGLSWCLGFSLKSRTRYNGLYRCLGRDFRELRKGNRKMCAKVKIDKLSLTYKVSELNPLEKES